MCYLICHFFASRLKQRVDHKARPSCPRHGHGVSTRQGLPASPRMRSRSSQRLRRRLWRQLPPAIISATVAVILQAIEALIESSKINFRCMEDMEELNQERPDRDALRPSRQNGAFHGAAHQRHPVVCQRGTHSAMGICCFGLLNRPKQSGNRCSFTCADGPRGEPATAKIAEGQAKAAGRG